MKGFRTFALAAITVVLGVLETTDVLPWDADVTGMIVIVLGFVAAYLRTQTNTPPGKSV